MRAWLITWDYGSESAEFADDIAAILPPQWSPERVADFVEQLYALRSASLTELAAYAKHPKSKPYHAQKNGHADILTCGHNPWLYARKVSEFEVTVDADGFEVAAWREPDRYRRTDDSESELVRKGVRVTSARIVQGPLSSERVWDASTHSRRAQFSRKPSHIVG